MSRETSMNITSVPHQGLQGLANRPPTLLSAEMRITPVRTPANPILHTRVRRRAAYRRVVVPCRPARSWAA